MRLVRSYLRRRLREEVPVIAPDLGAFGEIVEDDVTGRLFPPADSDELARCIEDLCDDDASLHMGQAALDVYERLYTPERYVERLLAIYDRAQEVHGAARVGASLPTSNVS